jgi:uncharacterized protein YdeI (YjbR/CyaY-like superfamily)
MSTIDPADTSIAPDRSAWRAWLREHHATRTVVWLLLGKKAMEQPGVSYDEAVEEALCWGWVDGLVNRWDEQRYAVRFTPRRPRSVWSESNVARAERMIAEGRMTAAGLALVDEAKRRGTWAAAASGRSDTTPPDLLTALEAVPAALAQWDAWAASPRRQYVSWVLDAKRDETRARRVADVVRRSAARLKPGERG